MGGLVKHLVSILCLLGLAPAVLAALLDRGNGLLFDDQLNVTWTRSANLPAAAGGDGRMTWDAAQSWVAQLEWGGFSDWRLPSARLREGFSECSAFDGSCDQGYQVVNSELGHLFYSTLGNRGFYDINGAQRSSGFGLVNRTYRGDGISIAFDDLQAWPYWFGEEGSSMDEKSGLLDAAWIFGFISGQQFQFSKETPAFVWAVRDGDVAPVPLPGGLGLFMAGLGALLFARQRCFPQGGV